jgi:hypothetical protein
MHSFFYLRQKKIYIYKKLVVATIKLMTQITNALSSKEASPNEKGQISSINRWQSYGSSYNKWMKKSALHPLAAAWKRDEKEKPLHQYVACSPQQVDEKGLFFLLPLLGKRDEKELKRPLPSTTNMSVNSSHNKWMKKEVSCFFTYLVLGKWMKNGGKKKPIHQ